jgi:hypothetical protein
MRYRHNRVAVAQYIKADFKFAPCAEEEYDDGVEGSGKLMQVSLDDVLTMANVPADLDTTIRVNVRYALRC